MQNRFLPLAFLATLVLYSLGATSPQVRRNAAYHPCRFLDANGDSIYFGRIYELQGWRDHFLLAQDGYEGGVYLLDVQSLQGVGIGGVGEGPGEYRKAVGFSVRGDTLIITHRGLTQVSRFLLPTGKFLDTSFPGSLYPHEQVWEDEGTFLATDLPRERSNEGTFGRYRADGTLLEVFGEYDQARGSMALQLRMNGGYLRPLENGGVVFAYECRPVLMEYDQTGQKVGAHKLDMPWNTPKTMEPFLSEQTNDWMVRSAISSFQVVKTGYLIGARGWRGEGTVDQNYVALYNREGHLREIIALPKRVGGMGTEDYLVAAVLLADELWIAVLGDPAIRRLELK